MSVWTADTYKVSKDWDWNSILLACKRHCLVHLLSIKWNSTLEWWVWCQKGVVCNMLLLSDDLSWLHIAHWREKEGSHHHFHCWGKGHIWLPSTVVQVYLFMCCLGFCCMSPERRTTLKGKPDHLWNGVAEDWLAWLVICSGIWACPSSRTEDQMVNHHSKLWWKLTVGD